MDQGSARWLLALGVVVGACASSGDNVVDLDAGKKPDVQVVDAGVKDTGTPVDVGVDVPPGRVCRINDDCTAPDLCSNSQVCRFNRCETVGGTPSCDDGVACTDDSCDASGGRCVHAPNDMRCPSDQFCAGESGCVRELPCEIGDSTCARLNGDPCTGTWSCDAARLRCVRSAPFNCADTDTCTTDVCMVVGTAPMCMHNGPNYMTDAANCGMCGRACTAGPNQTAGCAAGMCANTCNEGFVDSDGMAANGCECNRMAADEPDLMFRDTNCDGIDGTVANAIFVSPRGNDANPGTREMPKRTIAAAVTMARMATPVKAVYAALGTYHETVALAPGVSLYGGYNDEDNWSRAMANSSEIESPTAVGLTATNVLVATEVQLFTIRSQPGTTAGESSYGVRVLGSTGPVLFRGCSVSSADGADGNDGSEGASGGSAGGSSSPCGANGGGGGGGAGGNNGGATGGAGTQISGGAPAGGGGGGGGGSSCTDSCRQNNGAAGSTGISGGNGVNGEPGAALGVVSMAGIYSPRASAGGTGAASGGGGGGGGGGTQVTRSCGGSIFSPCSSRSGAPGGGGRRTAAAAPGAAAAARVAAAAADRRRRHRRRRRRRVRIRGDQHGLAGAPRELPPDHRQRRARRFGRARRLGRHRRHRRRGRHHELRVHRQRRPRRRRRQRRQRGQRRGRTRRPGHRHRLRGRPPAAGQHDLHPQPRGRRRRGRAQHRARHGQRWPGRHPRQRAAPRLRASSPRVARGAPGAFPSIACVRTRP